MAAKFIKKVDGTLFTDREDLHNPALNIYYYVHLLMKDALPYVLHVDNQWYTWNPRLQSNFSNPVVHLWNQDIMGLWPFGNPIPEGVEPPPLDISLPPTPPNSPAHPEDTDSEDSDHLLEESQDESDYEWEIVYSQYDSILDYQGHPLE